MRSRIDACELDDEAKVLIELAREKFGDDLPVIAINESTHIDPFADDEDYVPDYSGEYLIDIAKLVEEVARDGLIICNIHYVSRIIEAALDGEKSYYTSRKYSFGDTPDWWDDIQVQDGIGRKVVHIDVSVYR